VSAMAMFQEFVSLNFPLWRTCAISVAAWVGVSCSENSGT
jgi:hypothetical protein